MLKIDFNDSAAQAVLTKLIKAMQDTRPAMVEIGEDLIELSKRSFETSSSPSGQRWLPNRPSTLIAYLNKFKGNYRKDGRLSKKGAERAINKKPLIGESRALAQQFSYSATANSVVVRNSQVYAAIQQFGGTKAEFPHLWGNIPARPFMPLDANGTPDAEAQKIVLRIVNLYLQDSLPR